MGVCVPETFAEDGAFPGKKSKWNGFDIYRDNGNMVVVPDKVAKGKPWIWRARFFGHQPQFDIAMLRKGYHIVYCNVSGLFGAPKAVKRWDNFYKNLCENHGFSKKVILEGMSRGGLIIYNWAAANPDKVAAIYGDAPVMDFKSWPGHSNAGILKASRMPLRPRPTQETQLIILNRWRRQAYRSFTLWVTWTRWFLLLKTREQQRSATKRWAAYLK